MKPTTPIYSICITNFNEESTLRESLDSILCQIDTSYEVIVVDQNSTDRSRLILEEYQNTNKIKLYHMRVRNRGMGRQYAFEKSSGYYIISNMDTDDIFNSNLKILLEGYRKYAEGKLLWARNRAADSHWGEGHITVVPRSLLIELGGWHDLHIWEDWELASRAAKIKRYCWTDFQLIAKLNPHPERIRADRKFWYRVISYREMRRVGKQIFTPDEDVSTFQHLASIFAWCLSMMKRSYRDPFNAYFDCQGEEYHIQGWDIESPHYS